MTRYYVHTYDWEKEDYTPQKGVSQGPYTLWGLKRALQLLRAKFGYECTRQDSSILVGKWPPATAKQKAEYDAKLKKYEAARKAAMR